PAHPPLHSFPTRRSSDLSQQSLNRGDCRRHIDRTFTFAIYIECMLQPLEFGSLHGGGMYCEFLLDRGTARPNILPLAHRFHNRLDRKSTRLNSSHVKISY